MEAEQEEKLNNLLQEKEEIISKLSQPTIIHDKEEYTLLSQRLKEIDRILYPLEELKKIEKHITEDQYLISNETDEELIKAAQEDLEKALIKKQDILRTLENLESNKDGEQQNIKDIILEIRAGTGGEEAALFAADLFKMYSKYCEKKNWTINVLDSNITDKGGYKEIVAEISGKDVYQKLKNEAGVHRVQRIPETEKAGRIHTSTATVAVLPKSSLNEVKIKPDEIEVDFYRSSGHGGQNIQKVETAVRIKHKPTGIVVQCQNERFQHQNREKAMIILQAKIWEMEQEKTTGNIESQRKEQVKQAKRAEKIRTYNYPQNRVTDHRLNQSWYNLDKIMAGDLDIIIEEEE